MAINYDTTNTYDTTSYTYDGIGISTYSLLLTAANQQYAYALDNAVLSLTSDLSIECWIKLTSLPDDGKEMVLVSKYKPSNNTRSYKFALKNDGGTYKLSLVVSTNGTSEEDLNKTITISADTWTHVAVTWDASGSSAVFYKNGASLGTATGSLTAISNNASNFEVGSYDGATDSFLDARIDEVRVWSDIRTGAEIVANYDSELLGTEGNLVGYWQFENDYSDLTSNATTLSSSGLPSFSADAPLLAGQTTTSTSTTTTSTSTSTTITTTSTSNTTTSTSTTTTSTSTTTTIDLRFVIEKIK